MSDEPKNIEGGEETPDNSEEVKNLKAEFSRKIDNQQVTIGALQQQNTQVLAALEALNTRTAPKPSSKEEDPDLMYNDPAAWEAKLSEKIMTNVSEQNQVRDQVNETYQNTVSELVGEFPELNQAGSEFGIKAREILDTYDPEQRTSPAAMRAATYQAAALMKLPPKSQRSNIDDDSFSFSGGGGGGKPPPREKNKLTDNHIAIARLLGVDVDNKETRESLEERTKRTNWNRWS